MLYRWQYVFFRWMSLNGCLGNQKPNVRHYTTERKGEKETWGGGVGVGGREREREGGRAALIY